MVYCQCIEYVTAQHCSLHTCINIVITFTRLNLHEIVKSVGYFRRRILLIQSKKIKLSLSRRVFKIRCSDLKSIPIKYNRNLSGRDVIISATYQRLFHSHSSTSHRAEVHIRFSCSWLWGFFFNAYGVLFLMSYLLFLPAISFIPHLRCFYFGVLRLGAFEFLIFKKQSCIQ